LKNILLIKQKGVTAMNETSDALNFKSEKERKQFIDAAEKELIQQYRKDSAEWMKIELMSVKWQDIIYINVKAYCDVWNSEIEFWHPDKDHNQMAMMEDKLIGEDCGIEFDRMIGKDVSWKTDIWNSNGNTFRGYDKSKLTAFRLAWTKYYNYKP